VVKGDQIMKIYVVTNDQNIVEFWGTTSNRVPGEHIIEIEDDHPFLKENHSLFVVSQGQLQKSVDLELKKAKISKKKELDQACHDTIMGRFPVDLNGTVYEFSCDLEAQSNFMKADRAFEKGRMTTTGWTAYLNGEVVRIQLDEALFDIVYTAHLNHILGNISKYRDTLEPIVDEALRVEDVMSVKWSEGGETSSSESKV
jgi:hypothetical protein